MTINDVELEKDVVDVCSEWPDSNSMALKNLQDSLQHLDVSKRKSLINIINEFQDIFKDTPGRTTILEHDVDVGEAQPVKRCPYR